MKSTYKKTLVGILTILAVGVFIHTLVHATYYNSDESDILVSTSTTSSITTPPSTVATAQYPSQEKPQRLLIPRLKIDANVQHVGIGKSGNMAVPTNYTDVGWYRYGTTPGQRGNAVIDGHVDNGFGLPGVFKHLSQAAVGDDIYIVTEKGTRIHFVITGVKAYSYKDATAAKIIFAKSDSPQLQLVTCTGEWVPLAKTYNHRLVISAVLAP